MRVETQQVGAPRHRREPLHYRLLGIVLRAIYRALVFFFRVVPREEGVELGAALATMGTVFVPGRKRIAMENLAIAFPEKSRAEHRRIMYAAFANLGRTMVEVLRGALNTKRELGRIIEPVDEENLLRVVRAKRGFFALSAHLGAFELIASLGTRYYGFTSAEVVRRIEPAALDEIVADLRRSAGVTPIPAKGAIRGILRGLKQGWGIGYVLDQNARRVNGVFVSFFGKPASTWKGLAVLAQRTGAPVLPMFMERKGHLGRHRWVCQPPIEWDASLGEGDEAIVAATARYTKLIEDAVRRNPEEWFWFHQRWRTRPLEELEAAQRASEQAKAAAEAEAEPLEI